MNSTHKLNKYSMPGRLAGRRSITTALVHRRNMLYQTCVSVAVALLLFMPGVGNAAQLNLANSPLFLETTVQPNIFYMLDDSGSMDWEDLLNQGTYSPGSSIMRYSGLTNPPGTSNNSTNRRNRRLLCPGFNVMAYDPNRTYTPWKGKDSGGSDFIDQSIASARSNPYNPSSGTNISNHIYFVWTDSDSDSRYDGPGSTSAGQAWDSTDECGDVRSNSNGVAVNTLTASQQTNYANWWSYYRKREYVLKRTMSELIKKSEDRVGFSTIWNRNNVGTQIEDIDDITSPINATAATNKTTLLDNLARISSNNGTPLRIGLENVGRYFEGVSQTALFGSAPSHTGTVSSLSPILDNANGGACQQNFAILMTDGFYNGGDPALTGNDNTDADGDSPDSAGNTTFDGGAYADTYAETLADVAMHYYERDLWTSLDNDVPVTAGVDDANHQHMVTYTVAFGVTGDLDPFDTETPGVACDSDPTDSDFGEFISGTNCDGNGWPDPTGNARIDDLWHAAYNGRGEFLGAKDPTELDTALSNAITSIGNRTGSASAVAANSRSFSTSTKLYQARFISGEWSGDLRAIAIDASGNVGSQLWSAKTQLMAQNWDNGRTIITRNASKGIPFRWVTSGADALTSSQQTTLNTNPATSTSDSEGQARLNYLRGDVANEGTGNNYRVRTGGFKLGDLVNSSPIFVGAPPFLPEIELPVTHSSFRTAHAGRREMVYVGGNDGMLHGFDANTGDEKIAYVPAMSSHFSNLNQLTDPTYVHSYYVDGSPAVADAFGDFGTDCSGGACWRTVLVGSMGGGGKGVFALDVTDPNGTNIATLAFSSESNADNISLWEFTDTTTPDDMGFTYGQPTIFRVKTSSTTTAWAAIFANGYNSVNERAILYVVNVVDGTQIAKINLTGTSTGTGNGLSTPVVVDANGDFVADYVYAGDLLGNMWKINLTDNTPGNWGSFYTDSGGNPAPLFKAVDGSSNPQPITERPEVGDHPDGEAGFMVYFGSGKYLEDGDKTPTASPIQTFYGIWDQNPSSGSLSGSKTAAVDRARLRSQTISVASQTIGGLNTRTVTDYKLGSAGSSTTEPPQSWGDSGSVCGTTGGNCQGWRVDLLTNQTNSLGEMSVSNPVLLGGSTPRIIFTTLIPEVAGSCNFGGTGWLMELNPIHGGQLGVDIFGCNCAGDTTLVGINLDVGIISEPVILRGSAGGGELKGFSGSTGEIVVPENLPKEPSGGRQSWRQLR